MSDKWKDESIKFNNLYSENSWEYKIPYFGKMVRTALIRREESALAFSGNLKGKIILDLGCGVGRFTIKTASMGATVHGYDISPAALKIAKEKANIAGVADRCTFYEANLVDVEFPTADIWFDLGCLQYIRDISTILYKLKDIKRFFSTLPRSGHWQNIPKKLYRSLLKGHPYRTYSKKDIYKLYAICGEVTIAPAGLEYFISSKS